MIDPDLYLVMNWTMVGDGVLFWSLVLDPRDRGEAGISFGMRALLAVAIMFPQILIGAIIALSKRDLYTFYAWCGRIYPSIGPLADQNYGGLIVWIPPAMMSVVALILVLNALRLIDGVPLTAFAERTGLLPERIAAGLASARQRGWLHDDPQRLHTTALGQRFLNDVIASFLA